jgi:hypothetical protein
LNFGGIGYRLAEIVGRAEEIVEERKSSALLWQEERSLALISLLLRWFTA